MRRALEIAAGGLFCLSGAAYADGHAKPYSVVGCGVTDVTVIDKAGGVTIGQNTARGTTQSNMSGDPFDNMAYECRSTWNVSKAGLVFSSRCTFIDLDGDRFLGLASKPDPATKGWDWTYLSGSGKWEGISGGGTSKSVRKMPKIRPGENTSCWESTGTYAVAK